MEWLPHDHEALSTDPSTTEKEVTHSTLLYVYFIDPPLTISCLFIQLGFFTKHILVGLDIYLNIFKCLDW
jgi:hypothetical protein